jgi:hypothetical protein
MPYLACREKIHTHAQIYFANSARGFVANLPMFSQFPARTNRLQRNNRSVSAERRKSRNVKECGALPKSRYAVLKKFQSANLGEVKQDFAAVRAHRTPNYNL